MTDGEIVITEPGVYRFEISTVPPEPWTVEVLDHTHGCLDAPIGD
jgi:hypothetical protein